MGHDYDKREHSAQREADDLTDYQKLNVLDGAGVLTNPKDVPKLNESDEDEENAPMTPPPVADSPDGVPAYGGDFNDGADFNIVDGEGKTNT